MSNNQNLHHEFKKNLHDILVSHVFSENKKKLSKKLSDLIIDINAGNSSMGLHDTVRFKGEFLSFQSAFIVGDWRDSILCPNQFIIKMGELVKRRDIIVNRMEAFKAFITRCLWICNNLSDIYLVIPKEYHKKIRDTLVHNNYSILPATLTSKQIADFKSTESGYHLLNEFMLIDLLEK